MRVVAYRYGEGNGTDLSSRGGARPPSSMRLPSTMKTFACPSVLAADPSWPNYW